MNHQRIKLSPLARMTRPNGPHDGIPVRWEGDTPPAVPDGEGWAVIEDRPELGPDQKLVRVLTTERDGWDVVDLTAEEIEARKPKREVTKLQLMDNLIAIGGEAMWESFEALISGLPAIEKTRWDLASSIAEDHPTVLAYGPAIKASLALTDEQFNTLWQS